MKQLPIIILLLATGLTAAAQKPLKRLSQLKDCDLIFHVADAPNRITDVTQGIDNRRIDHVGIFCRAEGKPYVVEAIGRGVVMTPLDSMRREGYFLVGRIRGRIDRKESLRRAMALLGRHYDHLFLPDNDDIYCSELVQLSMVDRRGQLVFATIPMSFHDATGQITPYWRQFYAERGMEVPEGWPGSNPGELSRRPNVKMKFLMSGAR